MKDKKILKNYIYNIVYQALLIITPIITTPYISRVLGVEGIGTNSSTVAVAQMFYILGTLGMVNYGSRAIAYVRDSKEKLTKTFWNIWSVQLLCSTISIIVYCTIFIGLDVLGQREIFMLQIPVVFSAAVDIAWLYMGVEDFKKTVTRNIIIKTLSIIFIFMFVKNSSDLDRYIIINSASMFLGGITMWAFIKQYVGKFKIKYFNISKHLRGALLMLIPQLAIQVYTGMDRTLISSISTIAEAGYYDQSQKLARIALTIVTSLSLVLMPRIANMYANKDTEKIEIYLKKSLQFTVATSCLIASGLSALSFHFVPIFFGEEFKVIIPYVILTSLITIFIPLGGVFANQFALPTGKNKEYISPLVLAAILNVSLNCILVPKLGAIGGVISIVLTEFITMLVRIVLVKKYLKLSFILQGIWVYFVGLIVSCMFTMIISKFLVGSIVSVIIEGLVCSIAYLIIIFIFKNPIQEELKNGLIFLCKKLKAKK